MFECEICGYTDDNEFGNGFCEICGSANSKMFVCDFCGATSDSGVEISNGVCLLCVDMLDE